MQHGSYSTAYVQQQSVKVQWLVFVRKFYHFEECTGHCLTSGKLIGWVLGYLDPFKFCLYTTFRRYVRTNFEVFVIQSLDTGRKLNLHKTFRRLPERLLNVLCTFNLRPVSMGRFQSELQLTDHAFSTHATFPEKLVFLSPLIRMHNCAFQGEECVRTKRMNP